MGSKLLSAWDILKEVENSKGLKLKERFLRSVLPTKKEEYGFLLDPRVKPLIGEELKKLAGEKREPEEYSLKAKIKHYWEKLGDEGKQALLNSFDAKDLNDLLSKDLESVWGALRVIYRIHSD